MRYVFVGAGAVGSGLGGLLARASKDVLLVARGDHAGAIAAVGLRVRCPDTDFTLPVPCVTGPEQARLTPDDVLVLATKTHQAEAAVVQWADAPVHGADGVVVGRAADHLPMFTALNGVASEDIALRYFERVFGVCVWFPTVMVEPGEVFVRGFPLRGIFHIGRFGASSDPLGDTELLDALRRDWEAADLEVVQPEDVMRWKYRKLIANVGNVLQALVGDTSEVEDIERAAVAEARDVLTEAGIEIPDDQEASAAWDGYSIRQVPGEPAVMGGSTWQSLARGTGTIETDYLNGEIALAARRMGRRAPINAGLAAIARRAARESWRPGDLDVEQLRSQLGL